jgi:hypothetical protein
MIKPIAAPAIHPDRIVFSRLVSFLLTGRLHNRQHTCQQLVSSLSAWPARPLCSYCSCGAGPNCASSAPHLEDCTPLRLAELIEREFGGFKPPPMFDD